MVVLSISSATTEPTACDSDMRTVTGKVLASAAVILVVTVGVIVATSASDPPPPRPEMGLDPGSDGDVPRFVAVSDGAGGIAGYAEVDLMDGRSEVPASPAEALEGNRFRGLIVRVFDLQGHVVGYFASEDARRLEGTDGFVGERTKDDLVAKGWRYVEGDEPDVG